MTPHAVSVTGLGIHDPQGKVVLDDITFVLPAGSVLSIVGESGGGKSLIAQAIMGLLPAGFVAKGTIALGTDAVALADQAQLRQRWARDTFLLPQEPRIALDPTKAIADTLALGSAPGGLTPQAALAAVDLGDEAGQRYPFALSGGMAQRALIATALTGAAPLILADEPTKGLDALRAMHVADALLGLVAQGRSLIVITHDMALVNRLDGHLLLLAEGALREAGPSATLVTAPQTPALKAWVAANPAGWQGCRRCHDMDHLILSAHDLAAGHGRATPLFTGLDLHLPAGAILGITGPSGCGKSTLGQVLLGLHPPRSGQVLWAEADPYADPLSRRRLRQRYQKLAQDPAASFLPTRLIRRQLADLADVAPMADDADRLQALLDRLGLPERLLDRYPGEISGGEAQRLALLRLLLLRPAMIVADEPTSRLDPVMQKQIISVLRALADEDGIGILLIAHDLALLKATADEVIALGHQHG